MVLSGFRSGVVDRGVVAHRDGLEQFCDGGEAIGTTNGGFVDRIVVSGLLCGPAQGDKGQVLRNTFGSSPALHAAVDDGCVAAVEGLPCFGTQARGSATSRGQKRQASWAITGAWVSDLAA